MVVLIHLFFSGHSFLLKFVQAFQIIHFPGEGFIFLNPFLVDAYFALNSFCPFRIIPKCRIQGLAGQVFQISLTIIDVKDTSLRQPADLLTP